MPNKHPKLSIVVPNYNGERYIETAIKSILIQSYTDFECIILDDGSSDGSVSIVKKIQASDDRIKLISLKHGGIVAALNHGLEIAKGKFIARMDSDDEMTQDRLKEQFSYCKNHPDTLLGTNAYLCDPKLKVLGQHNPPSKHEAIVQKLSAGLGSAIMHPTFMTSKSLLFKIGGYRQQYRHIEDLDLYLRAHTQGAKLANLADFYGLKYRLHPQSVSNSKAELQMSLKQKLLKEMEGAGVITPDWVGLDRSNKMLPRHKADFYRRWSTIAFSDNHKVIATKYLLKSCFAKPFSIQNTPEALRLLKHHLFN